MEIKILDPHDVEGYFKLRLEALKTSPEAFGSSYEEEVQNSPNKYLERIRSPLSFTFGALDNEELVGVVTLIRESRNKLSHKAHIAGMYVTPRHRGAGLGLSLLMEAINKTKRLDGIEQVNLTVVSTNANAKNLYSSLGFQTYGTEKKALKIGGTYYNEDYMVLFL